MIDVSTITGSYGGSSRYSRRFSTPEVDVNIKLSADDCVDSYATVDRQAMLDELARIQSSYDVKKVNKQLEEITRFINLRIEEKEEYLWDQINKFVDEQKKALTDHTEKGWFIFPDKTYKVLKYKDSDFDFVEHEVQRIIRQRKGCFIYPTFEVFSISSDYFSIMEDIKNMCGEILSDEDVDKCKQLASSLSIYTAGPSKVLLNIKEMTSVPADKYTIARKDIGKFFAGELDGLKDSIDELISDFHLIKGDE